MCQLCSIALRYGKTRPRAASLPELKQFSSLIVRDRRDRPDEKNHNARPNPHPIAMSNRAVPNSEFHITCDRLSLSPITETEAEELHRLWIEPAVRKYLWDDCIVPRDRVRDIVRESVTASAKREYGLWVARLHDSRKIIGFCGYWPFFDPPQIQLIYGLDPEYWGQGLATEMARAMLNYGFQKCGFAVIRASADLPNQASIAVMERLGMRLEKQAIVNGADTAFYQITPDLN